MQFHICLCLMVNNMETTEKEMAFFRCDLGENHLLIAERLPECSDCMYYWNDILWTNKRTVWVFCKCKA